MPLCSAVCGVALASSEPGSPCVLMLPSVVRVGTTVLSHTHYEPVGLEGDSCWVGCAYRIVFVSPLHASAPVILGVGFWGWLLPCCVTLLAH
jgi:hypothetical protein